MSPPLSRTLLVLAAVGAASGAGCETAFDRPAPTSNRVACPDAAAGKHVLASQYSGNGTANGKIRTFLQSANDIAGAANRAEMEIAQACTRIGTDLGVATGAMAPRQEAGGRATGACQAAAAQIDALMRQGANVMVRATPPICTPNLVADSQCKSACGGNAGDAECAASCRVHANAYAACTPALVVVTPALGANPMAFRLAATLQTNLPALLHAEVALGRRLAQDAQTVAQVGANLPRVAGEMGALGQSCIATGSEEAAAAAAAMNASVRASAFVTGRVGATNG